MAIMHLVRPSIRHFSAHRTPPDSLLSRAIATSCIITGVVLPFVPPAIESLRQRNLSNPDNKLNPPLCFHAR